VYERRASSPTPEDEAEQEATPRSFAERLRAVREMAGLSQDELNVRCCLHREMVSKFESGRKTPGQSVFLRRMPSITAAPRMNAEGDQVPSSQGGSL
jgi:ribosome-binding protein aMBF1 (putative translation factor)